MRIELDMTDRYTGAVLTITAIAPGGTVNVHLGGRTFQCSAESWSRACRAWLETQVPGVPGHNTQEENAK